MPRPKKIDRPVNVTVWISTSIWTKVRERLFSEIEDRVPFGAQSALVEALLTEWLQKYEGVRE